MCTALKASTTVHFSEHHRREAFRIYFTERNSLYGLQFTTSYIEDSLSIFHHYKRLAERAMEQVTDEQLYAVLDHEANSIAIIVKHMAGNMRSRWTDFLTADGEKPNRNRDSDSEFIEPPTTRAALLQDWGSGWACLFRAVELLTDADLTRTITIRGEAHSVMQAINRQVAHHFASRWPDCSARQALRL